MEVKKPHASPARPQAAAAAPPLPARFGQRLGILAQLYSGLIERLLQPHGLTWPQFVLLLHMARRGGPGRVSEMAQAVELTQPAVSKIVQKFAGLGLVEIRQDPGDQRNRPVALTPAGLERLGAVQRSFGPAFAELMAGWQENELERLITDMTRLTDRLEAMRGKPKR